MNAPVIAVCEPEKHREGGRWINSPECAAVIIADVYSIAPQEKAALRNALNVDAFIKFVGRQVEESEAVNVN